jgi:dipeptidyl aminopeptidase/acylaminoacyl peptidase
LPERGIFGGPPYGETVAVYREISPALNAERGRASLLKEYESNNPIFGMQLFSAARTLGEPVELVFDPDEGHMFSHPKHRVSFM